MIIFIIKLIIKYFVIFFDDNLKSDFEKAKSNAQELALNQSWTIETVSMMEWTTQGWNEKFFFPLEDQRLLRNQSNTILQDK